MIRKSNNSVKKRRVSLASPVYTLHTIDGGDASISNVVDPMAEINGGKVDTTVQYKAQSEGDAWQVCVTETLIAPTSPKNRGK